MFTQKNRKVIFFIYLIIFSFFLSLKAENVKTPAEESNFSSYSQNIEIARFLSQLDLLSNQLKIKIIGRTKESRNYSPKDLFLCIITEEGIDRPSLLNKDKPTLLIIASQHGNEQSAKEAALQLIRDLSLGKLNSLLQKINFLIIPQANPYGNWFNQRRNEQDLDLNRDHVKLESPEVKAIHRVFRAWMPEATIDVHEKGDDYYRVSIGCVSNINISSTLQEFSRKTILTEVENDLKKEGITFHEYLVTQPMGIDSSAGVRYSPQTLAQRQMMKRYSTTDLNDGRNSLGIYKTLSFIQEGASRHDLKTLKKRTHWQYYGLKFLAEAIADHGQEVKSLVRSLRQQLLERAKIYNVNDVVHLRMKYTTDEKQPTLVIKKFERSQAPVRGVLKVDKKAGDLLTTADIAPYPYPSSYKVVEEVVKNWFPEVRPTLTISRPLGYVIPAKYQQIIETMLDHGLKVGMITKDTVLEVEAYTVTDIVPADYDYLPPQKIEVKNNRLKTVVKKGDYFISCAQDGANLIPCLLEPQSQYGFIRYWKFKLVPQKNEIFPFYRLIKKQTLSLVLFKPWR
ncbi:MAG: M14 family zinc carboxypeptidase [Candidatus Aminicenantales bacterium]